MASNMATGLKDSIEEVYAAIGTNSEEIIDLSPTDLELTARTMGGFAPCLLAWRWSSSFLNSNPLASVFLPFCPVAAR